MPEYIRKEQVIELLHYNTDEACSSIVADVEQLPAADVVLVVHARWEETDWETWRCTHCGIEWQFLDGMTPEENDAFYCPNCGARMDGGESE